MKKERKDLYVMYEGKAQFLINARLLDKQDAWDNLEKIKILHIFRLDIEKFMQETNDIEELRTLDRKYTEIEFNLQEAWGFPKDARYHRFWQRPQCTCPKMDNEDRYGTGYSIINSDCLLHGRES